MYPAFYSVYGKLFHGFCSCHGILRALPTELAIIHVARNGGSDELDYLFAVVVVIHFCC